MLDIGVGWENAPNSGYSGTFLTVPYWPLSSFTESIYIAIGHTERHTT